MKYFKKIIGQKCYLSPMNAEDTALYVKWLNDIDVTKNLQPQFNIDLVNEKNFILNATNNPREYIFAIIDKETDTLIGNCGLHKINLVDQKCETGIFIGEEKFRNRGYGSEALSLILDFAFNILNIHNVSLEVYSYNKRAIRAYEKIGFKVAGHIREAKQIGRKRYDIIWMDILATEFKSPYFENKISGTN